MKNRETGWDTIGSSNWNVTDPEENEAPRAKPTLYSSFLPVFLEDDRERQLADADAMVVSHPGVAIN
jgi:hypothetical protein